MVNQVKPIKLSDHFIYIHQTDSTLNDTERELITSFNLSHSHQ